MKKAFKVILIISLCLIAVGLLLIGLALLAGGNISESIKTIEGIQQKDNVCFFSTIEFIEISNKIYFRSLSIG